MGYTHSWMRPQTIDAEDFTRIVEDFRKLLPAISDLGIPLANPYGVGDPIINDKLVAFNGKEDCGHPKDILLIAYPTEDACGISLSEEDAVAYHWAAGAKLSSRACGGKCRGDGFLFPREYVPYEEEEPEEDGRYLDFCKTSFKPYDIAVQAFLIIAKHVLGDQITLYSEGGPKQWEDARNLCEIRLGYGLDTSLFS